jgi:hypothetical protein
MVSGRFSLKHVNVAANAREQMWHALSPNFCQISTQILRPKQLSASATPSSARFGHTFPSQRQCPAGQFDTTQVFTHSASTGVI